MRPTKTMDHALRGLLVVLLVWYDVTVALAEQRSGVQADTAPSISSNNNNIMNYDNNYPIESSKATKGANSLVESALLQQRAINANYNQQELDEQDEDRSGGPHLYALRYTTRDNNEDSSNNYRQQPNEQWLGQIMAALSMKLMPTLPEQIHRNGRTMSPGGGSDRQPSGAGLDSARSATYTRYALAQQQPQPRRQLAAARQSPIVVELPEQQGNRQYTPDAGTGGDVLLSPLPIGLPQMTRTMASGPLNGHRANARRFHANPRHTSDTAEVAIHTPIHSGSVSDYEWKRVENSRWNNLRGMWGKRSVPADGPNEDEQSSSETNGNEKGPQASKKRNSPAAPVSELITTKQQTMVGNFM